LGRRPDGYHEVVTVLHTISLFDSIEAGLAEDIEVYCSVPSLSGPENLAYKGAATLQKATGCKKGAKIFIEKRIPEAMGLGGGSSDAAAALVALNQMWDAGLSEAQLCEIARSLGSDVPFFVRGGAALGEGRGEMLTALPSLEEQALVVVCPDIAIQGKTGRLYSMLKPSAYSDGHAIRSFADALSRGRFSQHLIFNVFEQVAFDAFPGLDAVMRAMEEAGAGAAHLSGSGPALFSMVDNRVEARRMADRLGQIGLRAYGLTTAPASPVLTL
jgi:4-diphosphocytidyl-2-C-methyl-D-erythritol kinase